MLKDIQDRVAVEGDKTATGSISEKKPEDATKSTSSPCTTVPPKMSRSKKRKAAASAAATAEETDTASTKKDADDDSAASPEDEQAHAEKVDLRKDLLSQLEVTVVDEGDRMLDLGFEPQLRKIFEARKAAASTGFVVHSSWFFSASWPASADTLARSIIAQQQSRGDEVAGAILTTTAFVQVGRDQEASSAQPMEACKEDGEDGTQGADAQAPKTPTSSEQAAQQADEATPSSPTSAAAVPQEFCVFEADKNGFTKSEEKVARLVEILKQYKHERVLVFCNMKKTVTWLHGKLLEHATEFSPEEEQGEENKKTEGESEVKEDVSTTTGSPSSTTTRKRKPFEKQAWKYNLRMIHSDLGQEKRCDTYLKFKTNKFRVLVGTDVVSRGLNIVGLNIVVNFDAAENGEEHLHRIGRCGRGGDASSALSVTFLGSKDFRQAAEIIKWCYTPSENDSTSTSTIFCSATVECPTALKELADQYGKGKTKAPREKKAAIGDDAKRSTRRGKQQQKGKGKEAKKRLRHESSSANTNATKQAQAENQEIEDHGQKDVKKRKVAGTRANVSAPASEVEKSASSVPLAEQSTMPTTAHDHEHGNDGAGLSCSAARRARRKQNKMKREQSAA
ncbi:unnamed protein product [Amoebophrya sp. A25]|nr:unnamed protein product [Amoebophrya sp. A25]|eukprot:GSA25T00013810001.1